MTGLANAAAGTAQTVTVTARDSAGAVVSSYTGTVTFTSSDKQATLPANYTFVTADTGVHSFPAGVLLKTAGSQTVTATDTAMGSLTGSQTATVSAGPLASLALSPGSASIPSGGSQTYTATGADQYGNGLGDVTAGTSFGIAPDGSCTGTTCTPSAGGTHTVTGTNSGKTASANLNVTAAARQVSITAPSSAKANQAFPVTVTLRDQTGNVATSYRGTIHFSCSDVLATLPADYTFTAADAGTHTFSVTLVSAGTQYITVADTVDNTINATSAGVTVTAV